MLRAKWKLLGVGAGVLLLAAAVVVFWGDDPLRSEARRAWRDGAVEAIQRRADDAGWVQAEVEKLRTVAATRPWGGGWVGREVLVMKNGDWMVCRNVCVKEGTEVTEDLFIGLGSDGKWYYSTFHFCTGLNVLLMEEQPESLGEFAEEYWLETFDGKSDESLKETWDGKGSWGMERVMELRAQRGEGR